MNVETCYFSILHITIPNIPIHIEGTLATYGIHVIFDLPFFKNLICSSHGNPLLIL